ncbi:MAG: hypothetical protein JXB32_13075 [Deltaproteobacteria bacterium]|nr:hypothetical protein [Deltaproteobacteria bacterium]
MTGNCPRFPNVNGTSSSRRTAVAAGLLCLATVAGCADDDATAPCDQDACNQLCWSAGLAGGICIGITCSCIDDGDGGTDTGADADAEADLPAEAEAETGTDADAEAEADTGCYSGNFNFFVTSLEFIQSVGGAEGLGGNLGGVAGADALCQQAADAVGACDKRWVAFLCASDDGTGHAVDAVDRVGTGPWYDVNGYLVANDLAGLVQERPDGDDTTVVWTEGWNDWVFTDCLTTELGNCNHTYGDSHDTLTGCRQNGRLYGSDPAYTCNNWTTTTNPRSCAGGHAECFPAIGHTWPAMSGQGWIFSHNAGGCQANINLTDRFETGVGGHGGYGGWYCFGLPR